MLYSFSPDTDASLKKGTLRWAKSGPEDDPTGFCLSASNGKPYPKGAVSTLNMLC
jgi:hypothetical protein